MQELHFIPRNCINTRYRLHTRWNCNQIHPSNNIIGKKKKKKKIGHSRHPFVANEGNILI